MKSGFSRSAWRTSTTTRNALDMSNCGSGVAGAHCLEFGYSALSFNLYRLQWRRILSFCSVILIVMYYAKLFLPCRLLCLFSANSSDLHIEAVLTSHFRTRTKTAFHCDTFKTPWGFVSVIPNQRTQEIR
jgi:hypothetical protein